MPTPKLFTRQFEKEGKTYLFFRYWDNHSKDYEYQVYELKIAKAIARKLGAPDSSETNKDLNTRKMCDWVWNNISPCDGEYEEAAKKKK